MFLVYCFRQASPEPTSNVSGIRQPSGVHEYFARLYPSRSLWSAGNQAPFTGTSVEHSGRASAVFSSSGPVGSATREGQRSQMLIVFSFGVMLSRLIGGHPSSS